MQTLQRVFLPILVDAFPIKQLPAQYLVFPPACEPVPCDKQDQVFGFRVDFFFFPLAAHLHLATFYGLNVKQVTEPACDPCSLQGR